MKTSTTILAILLAGFASASRADTAEQPVAVKTDHLPANVAKRVHDAAAKGPAALRRYVTMTRGIFALDLQALLVPAEDAPPPAAKATESPRKVARDEAAKKP